MNKPLATLLAIMLVLPLRAEVQLANVFRNGGVIQHGRPAPVWGLGDPGEAVTLMLNGVNGCLLSQKHDTVADGHGKWIVTLDPLTSGAVFHITVAGRDSQDASYHMQAGDVWFYAGQYRFRYRRLIPMITDQAWKAENADLFPLLKVYGTAAKHSIPQRRENGKWGASTVDHVFGFNPGIATHFGIDLCRAKGIPVGIVHVASIYGHWIDEYLAAEDVVHDPVLGQSDNAAKLAYGVGGTAECRQMNAARIAYMEQYLDRSIRRNANHQLVLQPDYPAPPESAQTKTALLYNGAIHPLLPLAVKGVIFNDPSGENPFDAATHAAKMALLAKSFRRWFGDPVLPVVIMQDKAGPHQHTLRFNTRFAAQQQLAQADPHVAIAVTHDIAVFDQPEDLFLKTIPAKGHRVYQVADRLAYGNASSANKTPRITRIAHRDSQLAITFSMPLQTCDQLVPDGFALKAKGDSTYQPAQVEIQGNTLIVSAPGMENPEHANYGYVNRAIKNAPNVVGVNNMPLPAFTTECVPAGGDRSP